MKRDFTEKNKQEIIKLIDEINAEKICNFTDELGDLWYKFEALIGLLDIRNYINNMKKYHKKVLDMNDTSKDEIEKMFTQANDADKRYSMRMVAVLTKMTELTKMLESIADTVSPEKGQFTSEYIGKNLNNLIDEYLDRDDILSKISKDGLTEEDINSIDNKDKLNDILQEYAKLILKNIPDTEIDNDLEIPIGVGVSFYYKTKVNTNSGSDVTVKTTLDQHKLEFQDVEISSGGKFFGASIDSDKVSVEAKNSYGSKMTFNGEEVGYSNTFKDKDSTYTHKIIVNPQKGELKVEESIKTEIGNGAVTSTVGIKKTKNNYKKLPEPKPVDVPYPCRIPQFNVDWNKVGKIAVETVAVTGAVIVIGAAVYFSGGTVCLLAI